jgi:hypothetical protein
MNKVAVLLSDYGVFNLHPSLQSNIKVPINHINLRTDVNLINLYKQYGNQIANNCYLKIEEIPYDIYISKNIIISKDMNGKESLYFYELDGDIVMKYW